MALFFYKASDGSGKIIEGSMEAPDESSVVAKLRSSGHIPVKIGTTSAPKTFSLNIKIPTSFTLISGKDLLAFTQELSTMIKAGLPLDRSLSVVAEVTENESLRTIAQEILKDIRGGKSLSDALAKHPRVFNRLYINMVKAGEAGGVLDIVLERLVDFLERSQELKSTVINALMYPIVLVVVMTIVVSVMLVFVVPRFVTIFDTVGQTLPLPTQILLTVSLILKNYWWLILAGLAGLYILFQKYTGTENGKLKWDRFKLKLALLKNLILRIEVARFSRTLGTLMTSGVPLLQAINIVKEVVGNSVVANSITVLHKAVKEGKGMSMPLKTSAVFPSLAIHMMRVGEETGKMEEMLIKVADTYDREVQNAVKRFISILEPVLILLMSLVVGFVVLSIIWAIFSINQIAF